MLAQHLPGLAMTKAENLLFDDMEGCVPLRGASETFSKLLGIKDRVHQKSKVVQQSSQVRCFGLRVLDFLRHSLRNQCAAERVPPKRIRFDHPLILRDDPIDAQPEQHRAYSLQAESHDRGAYGFSLAPSEERRICQAETLRGDRPIVRNQLHHFFDSDVIGGQVQHIEKRLQDCGSGRNRVQLPDLCLQL